jgi:23S rRNA pseudouridine955/2504/2580 synthase
MESEKTDARGRTFTVQADDAGRRLDRVLRKLLPRAPLTRIYSGLRRGEARVDGECRAAEYRLRLGEEIRLLGSLEAASPARDAASTRATRPGWADGLVLHRSEHFIVFDKPSGIPVHGAQSLASAAEGLLASAAQPSLSFRPGPVHRLDKGTSGLVFFAVSLTGAQVLSALLRDRACEKVYVALLQGDLEGTERWEDSLSRDQALRRTVADAEGAASTTEASPLLRRGGLTFAAVRIESGRTHQIRAQAALHGYPLLGDQRYGGRADPGGYLLHAARFRLPPGTAISQTTTFTAPLPPAARAALERHFGAADTARALSVFFDEPAAGER